MRPKVPEGYTEKVIHLRRMGGIDGAYLPAEVIRYLGEEPSPQGGLTVVALFQDNEFIESGWTLCMEADNFNKQIGHDIALGRALKKLS